MKKIIFSICFAALAIGCAKTEVNYSETDLISFAPVAQVSTKAALQSADFATTQDIYVFANAGLDKDADYTVDVGETYNEAYLRNAMFTRANASDNYIGAYYWPNVKSLQFAGYVDAGDAKTKTSISDDLKTMTVAAYIQPDTGNNDLMYFFTPAETVYTKGSGTIVPQMQHACSWLTFNFIGNAITAGWNILELKVLQIAKQATGTLTAAGATWDIYDSYANYAVFNGTMPLLNGTPVGFDKDNEIVVIPQVPTELYVKYSYVSQAGTTIEEETKVSLKYDGDEKWVAGKKYTYDVTVTATAIEINPTSSTWVPYDYDGNAGSNNNIPGTI